MNVLRTLARQLLNLQVDAASLKTQQGSLAPVRQQRVAPVVGLPRFRDAFEQLPQGARGAAQALGAERAWQPRPSALALLLRDGFEAARRAPVDLLGGARAAAQPPSAEPRRAALPRSGFSASLDDLGRLAL